MFRRRAVFTGVGVVTSIGSELDTFWNGLCNRASGLQKITMADTSRLRCHINGPITDFDPKTVIVEREQRKALRIMARTVQLGLVAAHIAFRHSQLAPGLYDPLRAGVEFGAGMIASELDDLGRAARTSLDTPEGPVSQQKWGDVGMKEVPPLWMLKYLPNMPSCHVSITLDLRGPSNTQTNTDAAAIHALAEASRIIERDVADLFVVGGAENKLNPLSQTRHNLFQELTTWEGDPADAHRPYASDRAGIGIGEGSGAMVLEELQHAKKRGATILAELVGYGSGFDRKRDGKVMAQVIQNTLDQAGILPEDVDHVHTHGLATQFADRWETRAISQVFGKNIPVWTLKGNIGATGAASGGIEMVASILCAVHGQVPPTRTGPVIDPECPVHVHHNGMRPMTKPYIVKLNFTDLGQVGVAVIKRWTE